MYPNDALLRRALLANAAFSGLSALVLGLAAGPVGDLLGQVPTAALRVIAVGLALFAVELVMQTRRRPVHPLRALGATLADLVWVAASGVLLVMRPSWLSSTGAGVVAAVAVVVLVLALAQFAGLRRYAQNRRGSTGAKSGYVLKRRLDASAEMVWSRLRDLGRIGDFYPLLTRVEVEDRPEGIVRSCTDRAGRRWSEEVLTLDDDLRALALRFVSEAPDFPFPMNPLVGGWEVAPRGTGSEVTLWYEFTMKGGPVGEIAAALTGPALEKRMAPVVEALGGPPAEAPAAGRAPSSSGRT